MKKHNVIYVCVIMFLLILLGIVVIGLNQKEQIVSKEIKREASGTFADFTECKDFKNIPVMDGDNLQVNDAMDYGGGVWILSVNGTTLDGYNNYLLKLHENGFEKYVDNGEDGLASSVYSTTFVKEDKVLTVTHVEKMDKTYLALGDDLELSEHLFYKDEYTTNLLDGAKTKLHMMELYDTGNSFVIQLKNGHFIINDGAKEEDLPYLLDYLEQLTPAGEKPVVEAWVISHAHIDHMGALKAFISERNYQEYTERLYVEGVYFSESSAYAKASLPDTGEIDNVILAATALKTSQGEKTKVYRPQTGQRYYFCDVTMDIVFTQEQLLLENYSGDYNDASTWCMFTIDGQTFLHCGDADHGSIDAVMRMYDSEYFNLDVFAVFHHGINVYDRFTDFCTLKTLLYTCYRTASYHTADEYTREAENNHLKESALEVMAWGDGTKILTFPYEIGTAETLELCDWSHHKGVRGNKLLK